MFLNNCCLYKVMPKNRGKVSLEELVRLKRAEHPNPEFWKTFERELIIKQRLQLQNQSSGNGVFTAHFWSNAKRACTYGCAALSGGAFLFVGVIGINSLQTADTNQTPSGAQIPTFAVTPIPTENQIQSSLEIAIAPDIGTSMAQTVAFNSNQETGKKPAIAAKTTERSNREASLDTLKLDTKALALVLSKPLEGLSLIHI